MRALLPPDSEDIESGATRLIAGVEATATGMIGHLRFNLPEKHNVIDLEGWQAMTPVMQKFAAIDNIRLIILRGIGGKAFVAGAEDSGQAIIPALLIRILRERFFSIKLDVKLLTESRSDRSISIILSLGITPFKANIASSGLLAGMNTFAPASDRALVVSIPIPEYPPVTIAVFPFRSMPLSI